MRIDSKGLDDGSLEVKIIFEPNEIDEFNWASPKSTTTTTWGKTDYCISCRDGKSYTIETYGDIAAGIEAAATCFKVSGDASFGLRKGSC
ncbi:MAG: hypothetical protein EOO07_37730 [Chitinophagaceae bacterium]|nr:MAG: hypothetical protein EOO07_37730 [Chitinophagaceae bacterium]